MDITPNKTHVAGLQLAINLYAENNSSWTVGRTLESALHDAQMDLDVPHIPGLNAKIFIAMLSETPEQAAVIEHMINVNLPGTEGLLFNMARQKTDSYRYRALRNPDVNAGINERRVAATLEDWSHNINPRAMPNQWVSQSVTGEALDRLIDALPERKPEVFFNELSEKMQAFFGEEVKTRGADTSNNPLVDLFLTYFEGSPIKVRRAVTNLDERDVKFMNLSDITALSIADVQAAARAERRANGGFESELSNPDNGPVLRALFKQGLTAADLANTLKLSPNELAESLLCLEDAGILQANAHEVGDSTYMLTAKARFSLPEDVLPKPISEMQIGDYPTDVALPDVMQGNSEKAVGFNEAIRQVVKLNPADPSMALVPRIQIEGINESAFALLYKLEDASHHNGQKWLIERNALTDSRTRLKKSLDLDGIKRTANVDVQNRMAG